MKKTITALAVFALGASLAMAAPQQDGRWQGHRGHRGFGMSQKMAEKLNLTDAQKVQIKDLNKSFREQNKAFFESSRQTMKDFRAAKQSNDTAKMDALRPTLEANRAQMKQLRDAQREKIRSILTPEQSAQLDAWKAQRQSRHEQK
ncbi:MAG TPA: Spy/CpxP family protein refolding chaperone [Thermoanaerobaculia bacterium]|nr:Spy/CpxP family protein refolding chaperone [Thermoanaerobaculia bacterium]